MLDNGWRSGLDLAKQGILKILGPQSRREETGRKGGGEKAVFSHTPLFIISLQQTAFMGPGEAQRVINEFLRGSVQLGCWCSREERMSLERVERRGGEQAARGEREEGQRE